MSTTPPKPTLIERTCARLFDRVSEAFLKTRGWKLTDTRDGPRYVKELGGHCRFIYEKHDAIKCELTKAVGSGLPPRKLSADAKAVGKTIRGIHHA
jgi:hypothetical protein